MSAAFTSSSGGAPTRPALLAGLTSAGTDLQVGMPWKPVRAALTQLHAALLPHSTCTDVTQQRAGCFKSHGCWFRSKTSH